MPFLMVNLDDVADCRKSLRHLRRRVRRMTGDECGPKGDHASPAFPSGEDRSDAPPRGRGRKKHRRHRGAGGPIDPRATLKQKLQRVRQRGVWRFLSGIAQLSDEPRSLAELDEALDLPKNKMRSTKAIFAKLENRLDVRFLVPDPDGEEDESGNARYVMPKRIRKQIKNLIED